MAFVSLNCLGVMFLWLLELCFCGFCFFELSWSFFCWHSYADQRFQFLKTLNEPRENPAVISLEFLPRAA